MPPLDADKAALMPLRESKADGVRMMGAIQTRLAGGTDTTAEEINGIPCSCRWTVAVAIEGAEIVAFDLLMGPVGRRCSTLLFSGCAGGDGAVLAVHVGVLDEGTTTNAAGTIKT